MTTTSSPTRPGWDDLLAPSRGSVLLKTYFDGDRPLRTQMLARRSGGQWDAYEYAWNEDGSDALPTDGGGERCLGCHNPRTGTLRALSVSQLNAEFHGENQLDRLIELGILEERPKRAVAANFPRLDDESAGLQERARAYLHVNCSSCHQPGGQAGSAAFDTRHTTPFAMAGLCNAAPTAELIGHEDARLITPGAPQRSSISLRMHATDLSSMPPQRATVDPVGTRVIDEWIRSLADCPPAPQM